MIIKNLFKNYKLIFIIMILVVLIISLWLILSPYKLKRTLPKIHYFEVESVKVWMRSINNSFYIKEEQEIKQIIKHINKSREVKNQIGTTPDTAIVVKLKNKTQITIWTLYSNELVTIGSKGHDSYYQTNVKSKELALLLNTIRKAGGLE